MKNTVMEILLVALTVFFLGCFWGEQDKNFELQKEVSLLKKERNRMAVQIDILENHDVLEPRPLVVEKKY